MLLALIAAVARNQVIGRDGGLPWRLPGDMKFFRAQTMGHHVLMGRATWASLPKPLAGRVNLVVTHAPERLASAVAAGDCVAFASTAAAIEFARAAGECELYVIGGATLYRETLPIADRIYLTRVDAEPEGDTFFPELDLRAWALGRRIEHGEGPPPYEIVCLERVVEP
ncbi:MAG: dihydrofolate reductase [Deltaproteobacteria bacterium]|nr:dihydrofolate reductase [Deltaproteobacteria bacterium]MBK8240235.1 dihydrofolate reductase [Deltaproteobacteria bacterium]MBK8714609.1 dihydrofolate reductase [Deltaproteobacteria bacterium]MBP7292174.1 dihydrofolate reductase [Nannocystaceae bacterium]